MNLADYGIIRAVEPDPIFVFQVACNQGFQYRLEAKQIPEGWSIAFVDDGDVKGHFVSKQRRILDAVKEVAAKFI